MATGLERARLRHELRLQQRICHAAPRAQYQVLWTRSFELSTQIRRFAILVDQVLRGAKPGDLTIEQPTRFKLAINSKIARTLGFGVPQTPLVLADEVIQ